MSDDFEPDDFEPEQPKTFEQRNPIFSRAARFVGEAGAGLATGASRLLSPLDPFLAAGKAAVSYIGPQGYGGHTGSFADRMRAAQEDTRETREEAGRAAPVATALGTVAPIIGGGAALAELPSVSGHLTEAAGPLTHALGAYLDASLYRGASEAGENWDRAPVRAFSEGLNDPNNVWASLVPAGQKLAGDLASNFNGRSLRRTWQALFPDKGANRVAREQFGGQDQAGAFLRDLQLPFDNGPVMGRGAGPEEIHRGLQAVSEQSGQGLGALRAEADRAGATVDPAEVLANLRASIARRFDTRGGRSIDRGEGSALQTEYNAIEKEFRERFGPVAENIEYPQPQQGDLGLPGRALVPGPEAQVELPPPIPKKIPFRGEQPKVGQVPMGDAPVVESETTSKPLAGATVPGAKANEGAVSSELHGAQARQMDLEDIRDKIYNPEATPLPGRIADQQERVADLARERAAVQRADDTGAIRDPGTRRNRLLGNTGGETAPTAEQMNPADREYTGVSRPAANSGEKPEVEEQQPIPLGQSLATQSEIATPPAQRQSFDPARVDGSPVPNSPEPVGNPSTEIRLRRPSTTEWTDLATRIGKRIRRTTAQYPRPEGVIGDDPYLSGLNEFGGVITSADEAAMEQALGPERAAQYKALKQKFGRTEDLTSVAESALDRPATQSSAEGTVGWTARHALPLSLVAGGGTGYFAHDPVKGVAAGALAGGATMAGRKLARSIEAANASMARNWEGLSRSLGAVRLDPKGAGIAVGQAGKSYDDLLREIDDWRNR